MNTYFIIGIIFMLIQAVCAKILSMFNEDYRNTINTYSVGSFLWQFLASALLWPVVLALNIFFVIHNLRKVL